MSLAYREAARPPGPGGGARQVSFDELGTPLQDVTFVVVDLETTGGSPGSAAITEIGAVKVRGGEVLGEFQTLVNPGTGIPAFIAVLTGITDAMVATAPAIDAALPAFLEFAQLRGGVSGGVCSGLSGDDPGGAVLVAHNAPFDVGFLRAACAATGRSWPDVEVVDTARLARHVLTRDDAANCKLATLAEVFHSRVRPEHRALSDARATVDVLHGLLERLAGHGVSAFEELRTFSARVTPAQRRKKYLAADLPSAPGVYVFSDGQGRALYVGKSRDIRARARSYFTASESRARMAEMVTLATTITPVVCPTLLEAEVRELRLLAEHKPRYNRRSRFPERALWLKLTVEAFPRLSIVRGIRGDRGSYLGPFGSTAAAESARTAMLEAFPLRQCGGRLPASGGGRACALAEMGRCGAPCEGRESVQEYARHVQAARRAMVEDAGLLVRRIALRLDRLAGHQRYEDAVAVRDRLAAFLRAAARMQRLSALTSCPELAAARPSRPADASGWTQGRVQPWEVAVVRHGRLVGTASVDGPLAVRAAADVLLESAEPVAPAGPGPVPAASAEETECVLRWLEAPGTRLLHLDGQWCSPVAGAARHRRWWEAAGQARSATAPFADRRRLRPGTQPLVACSAATGEN